MTQAIYDAAVHKEGWKHACWDSHAHQQSVFLAIQRGLWTKHYESVLDIGCGHGELKSYLNVSNYFGVDNSQSMAMMGENVHHGDFRYMAFPKFDYVIAIGAFDLLPVECDRELTISGYVKRMFTLAKKGVGLAIGTCFQYPAGAVNNGEHVYAAVDPGWLVNLFLSYTKKVNYDHTLKRMSVVCGRVD